jgi:hypothetical protein
MYVTRWVMDLPGVQQFVVAALVVVRQAYEGHGESNYGQHAGKDEGIQQAPVHVGHVDSGVRVGLRVIPVGLELAELGVVLVARADAQRRQPEGDQGASCDDGPAQCSHE